MHLLQSNLLSNHIEVRLVVWSPTELQDAKNNFLKDNKLWDAGHKRLLYHIPQFLKNICFFESFCSSKAGCFTAIKNASRFFLLQIFIGADIRTFHWKTWSGCWTRCLAGSESLFGFSCYAFFLKNRLPHISYMKDVGLSPSKRKAVWLIHPLFWWKHSIFSKVFGYFSIFVTERGIMENNRSWFEIIEACVRYFSSIFYF